MAGAVTDAVTLAPISGANLQVEADGQLLGRATSDDAGQFRVVIAVANQPAAQNFKLTVQRANYIQSAADVIVTSGRTDRDSYRIALVRTEVADCRRQRGRTVVVGYFRSPAGAPAQLELAARIKETLDYDVLARFQKAKFGVDSQPVFVACEQIKPQAMADYTNLAKVLKADAFLSGYVVSAGVAGSPKVRVEMSIGDQFDLLVPPTHATTPNIDLDDPASAQLQVTAQTAIFTALIAGYEKSGKANECVQAANVAEQAIGSLPPMLAQTRKRCEQATPNAGLTRGSPQ